MMENDEEGHLRLIISTYVNVTMKPPSTNNICQ
jgi:hypothetical protein